MESQGIKFSLAFLRAQINALPPQDRRELLMTLVAHSVRHAPLPPQKPAGEELARAETWFWKRIARGRTPLEKNAALRFWFIFMLLRHGGLRMGEIAAIQAGDLDFGADMVRVGGGNPRQIPLPRDVAKTLRQAWETWPELHANARPLRCDPGHMRRVLLRCARECALPPGLLNARSLRRNRGLELEAAGAHVSLADYFLGKPGKLPMEPQNAAMLLKIIIQGDSSARTSARNIFKGYVAKVEKLGILTHVELAAAQGPRVRAVITDTSCRRLELAPGRPATAIVKAPWVRIRPSGSPGAGDENCYEGIVQAVRRDALACEVLLALPCDIRLCALYVGGELPAAEVREGAKARACFSPFSVIVTA